MDSAADPKVYFQNLRGADLSVRNGMGLMLLHLAILKRNGAAALHLLNAGASVNETTLRTKRTPLMLAALAEADDIVDDLLSKKPKLNEQDIEGRTASHFAALKLHPRIFNTLCDVKADTTIKDRFNRTADNYQDLWPLTLKLHYC